MIFHSVYTMSISKCILMFETDDFNLIKRIPIWLPEKMLNNAKNKFIIKFNELFSAKNIAAVMDERLLKLSFKTDYHTLKAVYLGIIYTLDKKYHDEYKEYFGAYPETKEDILRIKDEMELILKKYKSMFPEKKEKQTNQKFSFNDIITSTELILGISINKNDKVYQFSSYFKMASEKSRKENTNV